MCTCFAPQVTDVASHYHYLPHTDRIVSANLDKLPSSRIVLISSVNDLGQHYRSKRQISMTEWSALEGGNEVDDSTAGVEGSKDDYRLDGSGARPASVFTGEGYEDDYAQDNKAGNNSTVDPNAGLLFRYSFTSPALVIGSLIVLFILVPALMLSLNALTSIEVVKGLEGKMVGGQGSGGESKKDQ